ncbi:MAG: hypothetical protein HP497_11890 [Nitrospira sp.]|nr:hypothetical protein [Nitrospira sp.]
MKLTPTEKITLARKSLASLQLSCDTMPLALRQNLEQFNREITRVVQTKRLKHAKLVLLETEGDK